MPAFHAAVLAQWEGAATNAAQGIGTNGKAAPQDRPARLIEGAIGESQDSAVETALRDRARAVSLVAQAIDRVDQRRPAAVREMLIGAGARQPGRVARLIQTALIGMQALAHKDMETARKNVALLL